MLTATCLFSLNSFDGKKEAPKQNAAAVQKNKNSRTSQKAFFTAKEDFINSLVTAEIVSVNIDYHGTVKQYFVPCDTVENTLKRLKIRTDKNDVIGVELSDMIMENQTIAITKIENREKTKTEIIPYETKKINADDMLIGETEIVQNGKNGSKSCTYKTSYFNDRPWHEFKISESVITPAEDKIIKVGTQNIIENKNADLKSEKTVLLKTQYDDNSFSLPKIELSEQDRDLLERIVTGEFGNSFVGSCLIAQAIKCAIVYDHYTSIADLIIGMGYVGDTNQKSQNAVEAAKFIFDENGLAVKHRLFYMCTEDYYNSDPGNFHSTQNFILQYENVKFFDRW